MTQRRVRIRTIGRMSADAASSLGGWVEETEGGDTFVAPYLDQAQLTGLLVQFSTLHLTFDLVAVEHAAGSPPATTTREGAHR